jgi:hypothetical protein
LSNDFSVVKSVPLLEKYVTLDPFVPSFKIFFQRKHSTVLRASHAISTVLYAMARKICRSVLLDLWEIKDQNINHSYSVCT